MYGDLLKYTDRDGLLHWITNGENLEHRFYMNMLPNIDNYDVVNHEPYYFHSDETEDEDEDSSDSSDNDEI